MDRQITARRERVRGEWHIEIREDGVLRREVWLRGTTAEARDAERRAIQSVTDEIAVNAECPAS